MYSKYFITLGEIPNSQYSKCLWTKLKNHIKIGFFGKIRDSNHFENVEYVTI